MHSLQMESPHEMTRGSRPPPIGVKICLQAGQAASINIMSKYQLHLIFNQSDFDWFRFQKQCFTSLSSSSSLFRMYSRRLYSSIGSFFFIICSKWCCSFMISSIFSVLKSLQSYRLRRCLLSFQVCSLNLFSYFLIFPINDRKGWSFFSSFSF